MQLLLSWPPQALPQETDDDDDQWTEGFTEELDNDPSSFKDDFDEESDDSVGDF